jgi:hypothetical protein
MVPQTYRGMKYLEVALAMKFTTLNLVTALSSDLSIKRVFRTPHFTPTEGIKLVNM